jgi:polysaccharide export outer membrane protein
MFLCIVACSAVLVAGIAAQEPAITGYLIQPSDVLAIKYRFTPEFDFEGAVLPDGTIAPPLLGSVRVGGLTLAQARALLAEKAGERLREPELNLELKQFVKPSFVVGGEVGAPGKFDLQGRITLLEAIAIAGGYKHGAKRSEIVLYRRFDDQRAIGRVIETSALMRSVDEYVVQPGDFVLVPQSGYSKIEPYIPLANIVFFNPLWWR